MPIQLAPNLIQGVSQQAPQQARDSQCEEQFDCFNSAANGCDARPPFVHIAKLNTLLDWKGVSFTSIQRNDELYLVCIKDQGIIIFNLDTGTPANLVDREPNLRGYLGGSLKPADKLRTQIVEDTVFIANRQIKVKMGTEKSAPKQHRALVFVSGGQYKATFSIQLSGPATSNVSCRTSDDDLGSASPGWIASQLVSAINTNGNGYKAERRGTASTFIVYRTDGADFDIVTNDDNGDTLMVAFKDNAPSLAKLPARGWPDLVLKVKGEDRAKADDFYVQYKGGHSTGVWEEVVAPDTPIRLDSSTMPHTLINTGYNEFTFGKADWSTRIAGDEKSARDPSFVGKTIRDVFWFSGRFGMMTENSVVFAKGRNPFTWFPDTVQVVLATAPIDISLIPASEGSQGASDLNFVSQMDDTLLCWAPSAQFRVHSYNEPLKQDTVDSSLTSAYDYAPQIMPLGLKQSLYFSSESNNTSAVRELQFNQGKLVGDTDPTSHIPTYIPKGLRQFVASDSMRVLITHAEGDRLYVYNYLDGGQERIQSAWNTWRLPQGCEVRWVGIHKAILRVVVERSDGLHLLYLDLNSSAVDPEPDAQYRTRLDMMVHSANLPLAAYRPDSNTSYFTVPYHIPPDTPKGHYRVITSRDKDGGYTRGREFEIINYETPSGGTLYGTRVTVKGDIRGYRFYAGFRIEALRKEIEFYVRSDKGSAAFDRFTVNNVQLEFSHTGYTRLEARYAYKPEKPSVSVFEGRRLGSPSAITETIEPSTGSIRLTVGALTKDADIYMINDSYLPSRWVSMSWDYTGVGRQGIGGER